MQGKLLLELYEIFRIIYKKNEFIIKYVLYVESFLVISKLDTLTDKNFIINTDQKIFQYTGKGLGKKEDFLGKDHIYFYLYRLNVFWYSFLS